MVHIKNRCVCIKKNKCIYKVQYRHTERHLNMQKLLCILAKTTNLRRSWVEPAGEVGLYTTVTTKTRRHRQKKKQNTNIMRPNTKQTKLRNQNELVVVFPFRWLCLQAVDDNSMSYTFKGSLWFLQPLSHEGLRDVKFAICPCEYYPRCVNYRHSKDSVHALGKQAT